MHIMDDKVVTFHYTLTNARGEVIESSRTQPPLSYLHGHDSLIPGLEKALSGKSPGDTFSVTLAPEEAYGQHDGELVQKVDRSAFGDAPEIEAGMEFEAELEGAARVVTIIKVDGDEITLDGNHPLAGETLSFEVEVLEIRDPTQEELSHGHAHSPGGHH